MRVGQRGDLAFRQVLECLERGRELPGALDVGEGADPAIDQLDAEERRELSPRAKRELMRIVEWWQENAGGPPALLFAELKEAAERLGEVPQQGARFATVRRRSSG